MKNGLKTSEFWLSALVIVGASVLAALDVLSSGEWTTAIASAVGAYNVSRGLAKVYPPKTEEPLTGDTSSDTALVTGAISGGLGE